jgi:hypothetical protein
MTPDVEQFLATASVVTDIYTFGATPQAGGHRLGRDSAGQRNPGNRSRR